MYYYSKRSRSKIVHQSTCQHIQNVSVEDVGSFENLEDAYAAGYRLCRHCSPIAKLYRKESDVLQGYCQSHAASVFFKDRFIGISTPISDWRIIPSGKGNEVVLYHKNTLGDKKTGPVPGYHLQRVSQNTISGYLEYISDHDLYRNMHPLYPVQSKKNSPPPMKGTKRYRKEQKRAAKKARRQSILHSAKANTCKSTTGLFAFHLQVNQAQVPNRRCGKSFVAQISYQTSIFSVLTADA